MKQWMKPAPMPTAIPEPDFLKPQPITVSFECLYGPHKANLLHRGTAYCRTCYDEKARVGKLIDQ